MRIGLLVAVVLLATGCAKTGMPPGGPVDRTAPRILATSPTAGATRVLRDSRITIQFTESMDRNSVESSIYISPIPPEEIRHKWKGSRLTFEMPGGLREATTYVITVGTGARDERRNALASSYTLAFTTGDSLDHGTVSGRVFDKGGREAVLLYGYRLAGGGDPNPLNTVPDYVTQTGQDGTYALSYLPDGTYRIFALRDQNGNKRYNIDKERLGISTRDGLVSQADSLARDISFLTARRDTVRPELRSIEALNARTVELRFSEPVSGRTLVSFRKATVMPLVPGGEGQPIETELAYVSPSGASRYDLYLAAALDSGEYVVAVGPVRDRAGNEAFLSPESRRFTGTARPDTVAPRLLRPTPADSSWEVGKDVPVALTFSEPMDSARVASAFSLVDSSGVPIGGQFVLTSPTGFEYRFDSASQTDYMFTVAPDSAQDLAGNGLKLDSTLVSRFRTVNFDTLSRISGRVSDPHDTSAAPAVLNCDLLPERTVSYTQVLSVPGDYSFDDVLPGDYIIWGFRDANSDSVYDYGCLEPFNFAERFFFYPDTIHARANWPNEGNDIEFGP